LKILRFVDLFAGIGGIREGFEQAASKLGYETECVLSCEIDPAAQETYFKNFGDTPISDIRKLFDLPEHDVMLAGFPCQAFSYGGTRRGLEDARGTLFFELARLLKAATPRMLLFENVRGLMTHDGGRTYQTMERILNDLDYGVNPIQLNSSHYGVPQNRMRVYMVGLKDGQPLSRLTDNLGAPDTHAYKRRINNRQLRLISDETITLRTVKDILEPNPDKSFDCSNKFLKQLSRATGGDFEQLHGKRMIDYRNGNSIHSWELGLRGICTNREIEFMNDLVSNRRKKKFGSHQDGKRLTLEQIRTFWPEDDLESVIAGLVDKKYLSNKDCKYNPMAGNYSFEIFKFLDPDGISITLTSSDCNRIGVVQNGRPRHITPREAARLQGFPDSFALHDDNNEAFKQIGNSVSVPVIELVCNDFLHMNPMTSVSQHLFDIALGLKI